MLSTKNDLGAIVSETNEQVRKLVAAAHARIEQLVTTRRGELEAYIARANQAIELPSTPEYTREAARAALKRAMEELDTLPFLTEDALGELPYVELSNRQANPTWRNRF